MNRKHLSRLSIASLIALSISAYGGVVHGEPPAKPKPKFTNRLARETSPYLLMHAHNPVDWHPWGPEAFAKAKKENKLIFLSIGYSSCYWCHVMERQSFMNEEVAKLMNETCVCIKVDREERPDVDNIYMTALHVQRQRGGWPLSMFLTPDGKPIGGGTYWPPDDREVDGQKVRGFKSILKIVSDDWKAKREAMEKHADEVADAVNMSLAAAGRKIIAAKLSRELITDAIDAAKEEYDPLHGGFGSPQRQFAGAKFPQPSMPGLILAEFERTKDESLRKIVEHTLDRMARGGIYDHLGGGFHRYSVDREWKVPHFEKMLYDNAQLTSLYSKAFALTKNPYYRLVVNETLGFIAREMTSPEGIFYSALDAETDAEEGKFYVWTAKEIDDVLGNADAAVFKKVYGVDQGPNFEEKFSVLLLPKPTAEAARELKMTPEQLASRIHPLKEKLFDVRAKRARPFLDTKVLTSWNGLMIAGYADAAMAFENPAYAAVAERAAENLLKVVRTKDGRLLRTYSKSEDGKAEAKLNAYLEDYAFLVHGLLTLHDATKKQRWLDEAVALTSTMIQHYQDKESGAFFFTSHDHEKLFAKAKDQYDGATPAGNSIAALNLLRLSAKTGDARYRPLAEDTFKAFTFGLKNNSSSLTAMARALAWFLDTEAKSSAGPRTDVFNPNQDRNRADPVKVSAVIRPEKPGQDGKQTVTVTFEIEKGWHIYANPTGIDELTPTTLAFTGKNKPADVKIDYPIGTEMKAPDGMKGIRVYEGKTTIPIQIKSLPDAGPLELTVNYQACDDRKCLPPATVKLTVGK